MKKTMVVLQAGPAGLSCALEGARKGLKVTLLEKAGGDRINCGEGFDPSAWLRSQFREYCTKLNILSSLL